MTAATNERYWIAINGSSCALTSLPFQKPLCTPTPAQMLGFPTLEEAQHAQGVYLNATMDEVCSFLEGLRPDVKSGRILVIQPTHPQPQTSGPTMWTESADVHADVQQRYIKTTAN